MRAPRLTRKLTLETAQRTADGAGGQNLSWSVLGTLWAEISLRSGRERAGEGGQVSQTGYRVSVRAAPPTSTMRPRVDQRFREGGRIFRILSVGERDPEGRYLTCFVQEELSS